MQQPRNDGGNDDAGEGHRDEQESGGQGVESEAVSCQLGGRQCPAHHEVEHHDSGDAKGHEHGVAGISRVLAAADINERLLTADSAMSARPRPTTPAITQVRVAGDQSTQAGLWLRPMQIAVRESPSRVTPATSMRLLCRGSAAWRQSPSPTAACRPCSVWSGQHRSKGVAPGCADDHHESAHAKAEGDADGLSAGMMPMAFLRSKLLRRSFIMPTTRACPAMMPVSARPITRTMKSVASADMT